MITYSKEDRPISRTVNVEILACDACDATVKGIGFVERHQLGGSALTVTLEQAAGWIQFAPWTPHPIEAKALCPKCAASRLP